MNLYNNITKEGIKLLDKVKKEIEKLKRYEIEWDSMMEHPFGECIKYDDVISLLVNDTDENIITKKNK